MTNPRHLFILLGFVAQGLTWDNYFLLLLATGLWCLAAGPFSARLKTTLTTEAIALVVGCTISILISRQLSRSAHFFLGDGLILLQLVRLTRQTTKREKLTSLVIAAFHFAVLCTLAPNIRFLLLFTAAIFFFPGALKEVFNHSRMEDEVRQAYGIRLIPTFRVALWMVLGSAFVFLTFPRFTGTPLQLRESFADQGSLLDTIIDPRRGGRANSQQVLLQIEGENVGYLRCFALTDTDGVRWWSNPKAPLLRLPWTNEAGLLNPRYAYRRVFVKNALYLAKIVPVDGRPKLIKRNFFDWPFENKFNGALESSSMWTTGNNIYEYWVEKDPEPQPLQPDVRRQLSFHPKQSDRLRAWLQDITAHGTNTLQKARLVEAHLRSKYTYKMGSPDLNRLAPIDDLIFNRKEGHCERFATALALFLRMQGIPSRVVIGYAATTRNLFSNRLQVRFRDAHSWTEGYIDGAGWVSFDATPGPPPSSGGSDLLDFIEAIDFAWYSHVVNFNGFAQKELLARSLQNLAHLRIWKEGAWTFLGVLTLALLVRSGAIKKFRIPLQQRKARVRAKHYYDEMVHALQKRGLTKRREQTPIEFLEELRSHAAYGDAAIITQTFCRGFYGEKVLTAEEQSQARDALERLKSLSKQAFKASSSVPL